MRHTLFITGGAGYVGAMLVEQFARRDDVERVIALDKEPMPENFAGNDKIVWVGANTSDGSWQETVAQYKPDIVVHTAWQIRALYGKEETTWKWNVAGSQAIFKFAFENEFVKRLTYFSTASIYGAYKTNTIEHRFKESEPMREEEYLYGVEKRKVEEILNDMIEAAPRDDLHVAVVRPAAITGPRGRFMRIRFGLQSALSGQLKGDFLYRIISLLVSFVPATPWWVRQFVHEDDVVDIVETLSFKPWQGDQKEIFNLAPPGPAVLAPDMAKAVGKKMIIVPTSLIRLAYFLFWHLSRGKVPTSPGVWRFYSYPIVMDGTKLTKLYGFKYSAESLDAFSKTAGRYESFVPEDKRV